jgi:hypothetical protein
VVELHVPTTFTPEETVLRIQMKQNVILVPKPLDINMD